MLDPFETEYRARQTYREIKIMSRLSEFQNNIYTPKLYDIILPSDSVKTSISMEKWKDYESFDGSKPLTIFDKAPTQVAELSNNKLAPK